MAFTITFHRFPMEGHAFLDYLHNTFGVKPEELELAEAGEAPGRVSKADSAKLDQDILAAIRGASPEGAEVRATMGAIKRGLTGWAGINTNQVRRRLAALEAEGAISHSGQKRGTVYIALA